VGPACQRLSRHVPRPDWLPGKALLSRPCHKGVVPTAPCPKSVVPCLSAPGHHHRPAALRPSTGRVAALTPFDCHTHFPSSSLQVVAIEVTARERVEASVLFRAGESPPSFSHVGCRRLPPLTFHFFFFSRRTSSQSTVAVVVSSPKAPSATSLCTGEASAVSAPCTTRSLA
jgi:hypothetical protein